MANVPPPATPADGAPPGKPKPTRAENALQQQVDDHVADLAAAHREMESFIYSISHDLRAPLRALNGFSQALMEDYADVLDDSGKEYLAFIQKSAVDLSDLIDALLALARATRGALNQGTTDLSALAEEVVVRLRIADPEREVSVTVEPGIRVRGDARLLALVMDNLIGNAWKFTADSEAARIEVGARRHDGKLVCFVRDNGAGFDMAFADKLFLPFQRLHRQSEFPGSGIGLCSVQRIIDRHGGRVWAEGTPGAGATVSFELDAADTP